ncbi:MAG: rhomboid family intramembrane serine protease [Actinobacteria bacterium]|nr:rhomboid family intramembrane serine protease [Actinomycetota bacterium]
MFPIKDDATKNIFPIITYIIIALNVIFFIFEYISPNIDTFIIRFALIPARIDFSSPSTLIVFITSMFMHAGIIHILVNMWFLKIFGDNVEGRLGHFIYFVIYLLAGLAGNILQYLFARNSVIPMLGASGAVAGIMGAYLVFFPLNKILTLIFFIIVRVPAFVILIYWIILQIFNGIGSIGLVQTGGVAWWAHIGGFAVGAITAAIFRIFIRQDKTLKLKPSS